MQSDDLVILRPAWDSILLSIGTQLQTYTKMKKEVIHYTSSRKRSRS